MTQRCYFLSAPPIDAHGIKCPGANVEREVYITHQDGSTDRVRCCATCATELVRRAKEAKYEVKVVVVSDDE